MKELEMLGNITTCPTVAIMSGSKLLIGLRNYTPDKWKNISVWTLPGGRCNEGETLGQALEREVAEEVGITDLQIYRFLGVVPGAKIGDSVYIFLAKTKQRPKLLEPEKFSEWIWADIYEMPTNFINMDALNLIQQSL